MWADSADQKNLTLFGRSVIFFDMRKSVFGDAVVVALCLSLVVLSVLAVAGRKKNASAMLRVFAGDEKYVYPLESDGVYEIRGKIGVSRIAVENGAARFLDSPCPNKTCVASRPVSKNGEWAACLPNDMFIRVESGASDLDAVSY